MPAIAFMSDYGLRDEFVGVCHGVIARLAPELRVLDVTHGIPAGNVTAGALALRRALPYMPDEAVALAIVDPGVGGPRRPIALRCGDGTVMVGPDNGLLWPAAQDHGGIEVAVDIADSPHKAEQVSATFHGRDLFAPVATRLALGIPVELAGDRLEIDSLTRLELPEPVLSDNAIEAHVLTIDGFGNAQLDADRKQLMALGLEPGAPVAIGSATGRYGRTFDDVAERELLVYEDSSGSLSIAANRANAAALLGLMPGASVVIAPR